MSQNAQREQPNRTKLLIFITCVVVMFAAYAVAYQTWKRADDEAAQKAECQDDRRFVTKMRGMGLATEVVRDAELRIELNC